MESNNFNRISATGLKSIEIDELKTDKIIIDNTGLQYLHEYNILLPTMNEGYYNLQEEMTNIMISNTTQDLELTQLQSSLSTTNANLTATAATAAGAAVTATAALNLANQKNWIILWQKPLRTDISNNVYLDFNPNYFSVDTSNNLTLNSTFWAKDVSNNLYFTSGRVGIGLTNPASNYKLDVFGNINCQEVYRNGVTLASTLSNFLPTSGGTLTGVLTGTTISATNLSGSGSGITNINASNITSGTIGIGTTASPTIAINCYNPSSTFFQNIQMMNNASEFFYFGIAGNAAGNGSYLNNFFIQASKSLVFNSTNKTHLAVPDMVIKDSTVGINTSTPNTTYKLDVSGNINGLILYESGVSLASKYLTSASLDTTYLRLDGSASMTSKLLLLTGGQGNPSFLTNNGGGGDRIVFESGVAGSTLPYSIGYSLNNLWISAPSTGTINTYIGGGIKWSVGSTGALLYGSLNATTLQEGGTNLDAKYLRLSGASAMSGALTVNGNINITGSGTNSLIFDNVFNNRKIQLNSNAGIGAGNVDLTFYSAGTFTFRNTALSTTLFSIDDSGSLSFNGTLYPAGGVASAGNITSFATLTGATIVEGGVALSSKYVTSASIATNYLKLDGTNYMTGNLGVGTAAQTTTTATIFTPATSTNTGLMIRTNNAATGASILLNNDVDQSATIAVVGSSFPVSYLSSNFWIKSPKHFHVSVDNLAYASFSILTNGNVGIGVTNPTSKLSFGTTVANKVISLYDLGNDYQYTGFGSTSGLIHNIPSTTDAFQFRVGTSTTTANEVMRITGTGNVGIGKTNPNCRLYIDTQNGNTTSQSFSLRIGANGTISDSGAFPNLIGLGIEANGWSKGAIGWIRTGPWDQGDIVFLNRNTGDNADTNMTYERMRISGNNGNVNIKNSLSINGSLVNDFCFNNLGFNHADINDFNAPVGFGCRFIFGNNNGPNVNYGSQTSSYTLFMGLGINYPASGASSHGCQLALQRDVTNPTLSVRYNNNNVWSGWSAITAGVLKGTAIFTVNVWHKSSDNKERIYFGNNSITYFRAYNGGTVNGPMYVFRNNDGYDMITFYDNGGASFIGEINCKMITITNSGTDYIGVAGNTSNGASGNYILYVMYGTFTGFHRVFTEDEKFDKDEPQQFKDDYVGRIVVSTGKIATDTKSKDKEEWEIKYDKDGITIEDALPMIELSRTKKDKRVFGVLGDPKRANSREERLIVNSLGEGGIWVCNSNGNIENGDYITSSDYLGYGEKQDDDLLHNYTVAKATIDCDFQLDSNLYNCQELDDKIRIAFISCTYHCG